MKIKGNPKKKYSILSILFFYTAISFAQYTPATIYQPLHSNPGNYYPHAHDSATTVMPKLIKTNFLFYGFLSSLNQHVSIEYDKQMNDDVTFLAQVGIINSGLSQQSNNNDPYATTTTVQGGYFEGGAKLFFNPDYTRVGRRGYYTVEGLYLKPEFVLSIFNSISTGYASYYVVPPQTVTNNYSYTGFALLISLGGQWMIVHNLCVDLYAGAGVCFSNANSSNEPFNYNNYSYLAAGGNIPLALTAGANIGLPF